MHYLDAFLYQFLSHTLNCLSLFSTYRKQIHSWARSQSLQANTPIDSQYSWKNDLLWYRGKIAVPDDSQLRARLLNVFHVSLIGGHAGYARTYARLAQQFHWPGMRKAVQTYVQECLICQ